MFLIPYDKMIGKTMAIKTKTLKPSPNRIAKAFGSMPDFTGAILLEDDYDTTDVNYKTNPIWKINVPGYLCYNDKRGSIDADFTFCASNTANALTSKANMSSSSYYVYRLYGNYDTETTSATSIMFPIVPGTSTYVRFCKQDNFHDTGQLLFIPCACIGSTYGISIPSSRWCTIAAYGTNCDHDIDFDDKPSVAVKKVFAGDWRNNFTDLDLSTLLECRQSMSLIYNEFLNNKLNYKEVA